MPIFPSLTAIRIEVPPLDPEMARHTPEDGFIVDKVEAWVIQPSGQKTKSRSAILSRIRNRICKLRYQSRADPKKKAKEAIRYPSAFAALPKLFRHALDRGSADRADAIGERQPHPGRI